MSMAFVTDHWLAIGVGVFLVAMMLYGHDRGFIRLAVGMFSLAISLIVVQVASPYVTDFVKRNTELQAIVGETLLDAVGAENLDLETELPAKQRELIESLDLPEQMKEALLENNNNEFYRLLGVEAFADYLSACLTNMVLNLIGSVLLFLLTFLALHVVMRWLDLIARLPILSGLNQIAGALLGGVEGLLVVWLAGLTVRICSGMWWAQLAIAQIDATGWLSFLYRNNLLNTFFVKILNGFVH